MHFTAARAVDEGRRTALVAIHTLRRGACAGGCGGGVDLEGGAGGGEYGTGHGGFHVRNACGGISPRAEPQYPYNPSRLPRAAIVSKAAGNKLRREAAKDAERRFQREAGDDFHLKAAKIALGKLPWQINAIVCQKSRYMSKIFENVLAASADCPVLSQIGSPPAAPGSCLRLSACSPRRREHNFGDY